METSFSNNENKDSIGSDHIINLTNDDSDNEPSEPKKVGKSNRKSQLYGFFGCCSLGWITAAQSVLKFLKIL